MSATIDTSIYADYFARCYREEKPESAFVLHLEGKPNSVPEYYMDSLSQLTEVIVLINQNFAVKTELLLNSLVTRIGY